MQVDTLVVFYHPAAPGLHKRLRAEYRHPPVYVEASHPVAALLDEEQSGWSIAALGFAPITQSVYYWEEVLKGAEKPRDVYNAAPQAYAKRLDLYIPPRLAKRVELAVIPVTGEEAAWRFHAPQSTTLLHTLYHLYTWVQEQRLRRGHVRLYVEVSLAPPREASALREATRLLAYTLAAQGHIVEYAVYAAPRPPRATRKTPLVELERIEEELIEGPRDALRRATLEVLLQQPVGQPIRTLTPKTRAPKELAKRLDKLAARATAIAAAIHMAAVWAAVAIATREKNPLSTVTRVLAELVEADVSTATLQKYPEGGLLAHSIQPNPRHLAALALIPALTQPLHDTPQEHDPRSLPVLAATSPLPAAKPAAHLAERLVSEGAWRPEKPSDGVCNPVNVEEAVKRLLIHPATIEEKDGKLRVRVECAEEALHRAAKA